MTERIEKLARKLGAEIVGTVPEHSAGAFGVAELAQALRERLEPGHGKRPERPMDVPASLRLNDEIEPQTCRESIDDGTTIRVIPGLEDPVRCALGSTHGLTRRLLEERQIERARG